MTEAFMEYRDEFEASRDDAMFDIKKIAKERDPTARQQLEEQAQENTEQAQKYVSLMESESRSGDSSQRRKMQQQVRSCKKHMETLRNNFQKARLMSESKARHEQAAADARSGNSNQRDQQANYQKRLDKTGDYLHDAQRQIAETEEIGVNIDTNLARQREQIEGARRNVDSTRDNTREAGSHLSSLSRKALTNTLCLYTVILLLLGGIGYAIYIKFIQDKEEVVATTEAPTEAPSLRF